MIRNIVFDLGNVLISFRPGEYLEKAGYPEDLRGKIMKDIFMGSEWLLLDNGDIDTREAIDRISRKSSLKRDEIERIFNKRTEIMFPLGDNTKILPALKESGYSLYYLSNFPADIFDDIKNSNDFFRNFDGGIISSHVRYSKPESEIFRILFNRYGLVPEESLYIDDNELNVKAGEELGMKGFFTRGSTDISSGLRSFLASA